MAFILIKIRCLTHKIFLNCNSSSQRILSVCKLGKIEFSWLRMLDENDRMALEPRNAIFKEVSPEDLIDSKYKNSLQAAHVMIYAPMDTNALPPDRTMKFCVLMQFRFDGSIGFSGGEVDSGESPQQAVIRETEEEMGVSSGTFVIDQNNLVAIHYSEEKDILLHFYSKKISMEQLVSMEKSALKCDSYGDEVMGLIRVPLYTMSDGFRGFPSFLTNCFVGNAKQQLLMGLIKEGIMTQEEIYKALNAKPIIPKKWI